MQHDPTRAHADPLLRECKHFCHQGQSDSATRHLEPSVLRDSEIADRVWVHEIGYGGQLHRSQCLNTETMLAKLMASCGGAGIRGVGFLREPLGLEDDVLVEGSLRSPGL